jgi:signal transduction histidine kinase
LRSLYLRIYLTVVAALALFALASGALVQRHLQTQFEEQHGRVESAARQRAEAWGDLIERALPPADAPAIEQVAALRDWSQRLRLPMALDDARGQRIARSDSFIKREFDTPPMAARLQSVRFEDGRTLWVPRPNPQGPVNTARHIARISDMRPAWLGGGPRAWPAGVSLAVLLVVLFLAVAAGAWPVVRGLTRRLEALKSGVEAFGGGALHLRVSEDGRDEVAAVGASFNRAAGRIEALLQSHQSMLANASHELRSPLARLKMAIAILEDASPAQRLTLRKEIDTNIAELDALVEEVLMASRLDGAATLQMNDEVSLLGLVAEEAARVGASASGADLHVQGDERLLRRAVRNLLENACRYGGSDVEVEIQAQGEGSARQAVVRVCDRGPGVPEVYRERIFEAFFRLPGHAEREGGVGLGLSLVRQIAMRHGGTVRCEAREGGGGCFVLALPLRAGAGQHAV